MVKVTLGFFFPYAWLNYEIRLSRVHLSQIIHTDFPFKLVECKRQISVIIITSPFGGTVADTRTWSDRPVPSIMTRSVTASSILVIIMPGLLLMWKYRLIILVCLSVWPCIHTLGNFPQYTKWCSCLSSSLKRSGIKNTLPKRVISFLKIFSHSPTQLRNCFQVRIYLINMGKNRIGKDIWCIWKHKMQIRAK